MTDQLVIPHTATIVLLIGLPGSGKSSLARFLLSQWQGCRLISPDLVRAELYGDATIQGNWETIEAVLLRQLRSAGDCGDRPPEPAALYDGTNADLKYRTALLEQLHKCGFTQIIGVWLDVPLELCLDRNNRRDRRVPPAVIEAMNQALSNDPPCLAEGFNQLIWWRWRQKTGVQFFDLTHDPYPLGFGYCDDQEMQEPNSNPLDGRLD
jgi:predicted kinase